MREGRNYVRQKGESVNREDGQRRKEEDTIVMVVDTAHSDTPFSMASVNREIDTLGKCIGI